MKPSNKKKLMELKKRLSKIKPSSNVIIYDPNDPMPELPGKGPYIMVPDNGRRIPFQNLDEEENHPKRWFIKMNQSH